MKKLLILSVITLGGMFLASSSFANLAVPGTAYSVPGPNGWPMIQCAPSNDLCQVWSGDMRDVDVYHKLPNGNYSVDHYTAIKSDSEPPTPPSDDPNGVYIHNTMDGLWYYLELTSSTTETNQ